MSSIASRDISIFVDRTRKRFTNHTEEKIQAEFCKYFPQTKFQQAGFEYEGFHSDTELGRLTVLPGTVHIWLFIHVYGVRDSIR